jgi:hypothetical protein
LQSVPNFAARCRVALQWHRPWFDSLSRCGVILSRSGIFNRFAFIGSVLANETRASKVFAVALAGIATLAMTVSPSAIAALGGDAATVVADQVHINGKLVVSPTQKYIVHEIQAPSGAVVREFASPAGTVFGVAWSGPTMPDLRQVLGPYFERYVEAAAQRKRRGPVLIEQPGLVVQSGGHMRAFVGKAYVPEAVPQGVATDEIR